jgi:hypothetical protein
MRAISPDATSSKKRGKFPMKKKSLIKHRAITKKALVATGKKGNARGLQQGHAPAMQGHAIGLQGGAPAPVLQVRVP